MSCFNLLFPSFKISCLMFVIICSTKRSSKCYVYGLLVLTSFHSWRLETTKLNNKMLQHMQFAHKLMQSSVKTQSSTLNLYFLTKCFFWMQYSVLSSDCLFLYPRASTFQLWDWINYSWPLDNGAVGALTLHAVENPSITYSWPFNSTCYLWFQPNVDSVVLQHLLLRKALVSGPMQYKPMCSRINCTHLICTLLFSSVKWD